jgi:hypothetical protein
MPYLASMYGLSSAEDCVYIPGEAQAMTLSFFITPEAAIQMRIGGCARLRGAKPMAYDELPEPYFEQVRQFYQHRQTGEPELPPLKRKGSALSS